MKLLLDLAKILFSRAVILCLVAVVLVASDAIQSKKAAISAAGLEFDKTIKELNDVKQTRLRQIEAIKKKIQYLSTLPPQHRKITKAERAVLRAAWVLKNKKHVKKLEAQKDELLLAISNDASRITSEINNKASALARLNDKDLWSRDFIYNSIENHLSLLLILTFGLFLGPVSTKAVNFYFFAPLAKGVKPITINPRHEEGSADIQYGVPLKEIQLNIDNTQALVVRPGWFNLNTEGVTRTRLFWDRTKPFASYAMGLVGMTEFAPDDSQTRAVKIASEMDPNHDILPIHLKDHPGYIVKHGHVVAITGDGLSIKKHWRLLDWKSWLFGSVRYVYFSGTGSLYVHGYGSVSTNEMTPNSRIKERHLIGFDSRTPFKMVRTETFINYWLNKKPLYDINFPVPGHFLQQQSFGHKDEKIFRSLLEDIMGATGKLLGF